MHCIWIRVHVHVVILSGGSSLLLGIAKQLFGLPVIVRGRPLPLAGAWGPCTLQISGSHQSVCGSYSQCAFVQ